MLAPDDAAVAARNPSLPGLGVALDPAAVAEEIARAVPALDVVGARAVYVRLKPPTSCLVGYRLTRANGTEVDAYLRTASGADGPKLQKAVAAARRRAGDEAAAALLGPCTAILISPSDHALTAVVRLADPHQRRRLLSRALDRPVGDGWRMDPLRYKPERRWVAMLDEPGGRRLLIKVHRVRQHRSAVAGAIAFARTSVPVNRLVGTSRRHGITVHEWVEGRAASQALTAGGPEAAEAAAAVGEVLARLHARAPESAPLPAAPGEDATLATGVAAIAALDPAVGIRAARIAAHVAPDLPTHEPRGDGTSGTVRLLHGDCSVDQCILGADGPVLIDVDRAAMGDPHSDVAQLLADLTLRTVTGELAADGPSASAFLSSYVAAGGRIDRRRLAATAAARLLRLAPEPFRHRREDWAGELDAIVERAELLSRRSLHV